MLCLHLKQEMENNNFDGNGLYVLSAISNRIDFK